MGENGSGRRAVGFDSAAKEKRRRRAGNRLRSSVSLFVLLLEERKESFHPYLSSGVVGVVERGSEKKKSMKCVRHQLRASTSSHGASPSLLRRRRTCRLSQQSQQQRLCRTRAAEEPEQKTAIPDAEDAVFDENVN